MRPVRLFVFHPMDYADATLVSIADDFSIPHVVSFDAKDFGI
jgi:predicted nucleic acid-binding protein